MKKSLSLILLATALWLLGGTNGFCTDGVPWYTDPCYTNWATSNCLSSATIEITNIAFSPSNAVCLGTTLTATAGVTNHDGEVEYHYFYLAESATNNCTNYTTIQPTSPVPLASRWEVIGPGTFYATGAGLQTDPFTPTNRGTGKVKFYQDYTNASPCTGSGTAIKMENFTVNQYRLSFSDGPTRGSQYWPCSWDATLEIVCQYPPGSTNYTSLGTINYGFDIDSAGGVTLHPPSSGGAIVVDSFGSGSTPYGTVGAKLDAHYIGCCTGTLNWVQTVTTTAPMNGNPNTYNDHCPTCSGPFFFGDPGSGPFGVDIFTFDYPP